MVSPLIFPVCTKSFCVLYMGPMALWCIPAPACFLLLVPVTGVRYSWTSSTLWRTASLPVQCLCLQHSANVRNPQMQCMTYSYKLPAAALVEGWSRAQPM